LTSVLLATLEQVNERWSLLQQLRGKPFQGRNHPGVNPDYTTAGFPLSENGFACLRTGNPNHVASGEKGGQFTSGSGGGGGSPGKHGKHWAKRQRRKQKRLTQLKAKAHTDLAKVRQKQRGERHKLREKHRSSKTSTAQRRSETKSLREKHQGERQKVVSDLKKEVKADTGKAVEAVQKPKLTDREKKGKPKELSEKAALAQKHMSITDKRIQDYTKANENVFANRVGGKSFPDNDPIDVHVPGGGVGGKDAGIELKTLTHGKNDKITMSSSALGRKDAWEKSNKSQMHTVALDHRDRFAAGENAALHSGHEIYYKRGVGSFRIGSMHKVANEAELRTLMKTPYDKLPKAAQGPVRQVKRSMAQYISTEDMEMDQVATNQGWADFCDWARSAKNAPELEHLASKGWANDFLALQEQIEEALEYDPPDEDVIDVAREIVRFAKIHDGAEMIAVSNGMTPDDSEAGKIEADNAKKERALLADAETLLSEVRIALGETASQ
jgi:hypothetical protein